MLTEEELVEDGEDVIGGRVHVHPDLVHDHRLLGRQVAAAKERPRRQLADDIERGSGRVGRDPGGVGGQLPVRAGIHAAAAALDQLRQPSGIGEAGRSLEDEVLEQVREAGGGIVLVA